MCIVYETLLLVKPRLRLPRLSPSRTINVRVPFSLLEQGRRVLCAGLEPRRGGCRRRFLGKIVVTVPPRGNIAAGVATDASSGVHLGKTGLGHIAGARPARHEFRFLLPNSMA